MFRTIKTALTEKQQEKVYECWIRSIVGMKRVDERRLDELRVDVGVMESSSKKLLRSRLKCAGHMDRRKRYLERIGEQRRTTAKDRRNWRLLIENAVREK